MCAEVHISKLRPNFNSTNHETNLPLNSYKGSTERLSLTKSGSHITLQTSKAAIFSITAKDKDSLEPVNYTNSSFSNITNSAAAFDLDIEENYKQIANEVTDIPAFHDIIVYYWFDVRKHQAGIPGFELSKKIKEIYTKDMGEEVLQKAFRELDDILSSISNEDSIVMFFYSALALYQQLTSIDELTTHTRRLVNLTIQAAAKIIGAPIITSVSEALRYPTDSELMNDLLDEFRCLMYRYNSEVKRYLLVYLYEYVDCALANMMVTDRLLSSMNEVVLANTNLSLVEDALDCTFPRIRQVILVVIAHEEILENPMTSWKIAPLVPSTFMYFLLCLLKPDGVMVKHIPYKALENFASKTNVNLSAKTEDILFTPPERNIPARCAELNFGEDLLIG